MKVIKKYFITPTNFYQNNSIGFCDTLRKSFTKHTPEYALYRDKENPNYEERAKDFLAVCREFDGINSFIHRDVDLALELGATGVHLTSQGFSEIQKAKDLGLVVIISTHTHKEVLQAQEEGADYVTYSPIFLSPNKGKPKGVEDLQSIVAGAKIKIFALGGILTSQQVEAITKTDSYGFASIRYFIA